MAKRLSEHLTSLYLGAANRMKPRESRRRIVAYVESYDDVFFWRTLLGEFENDKCYFEVLLPSKSSLSKGKKTVLMNHLGQHLGQDMIACVDSDYDYLLQDSNETSRLINSSPFVFQTYTYAIENYQCYAESLHESCVQATLNDRRVVDVEGFIREFSRIVWPLFVWSIWAYRHHSFKHFTLSDFCSLVTFHDVNIYHPEYTLEAIQRKVNRKIAWLQRQFPQARKTYPLLKEEMLNLGVTPETTYLYMQGHALFDNVVVPLLQPICALLRKEREREIKVLAEHDVQRQNELACYQHSQSPIEDVLRKNVGYKKSAPYQRLRKDVEKFLCDMGYCPQETEVVQKGIEDVS